MLQSPVTPFGRGKTIAKSANFTMNANCFEECNVLATESVNSAPFHRGETKVQIFGKEKCKTLRQFQRFGKESKQTSSPISALLRWRHFRLSLSLYIYIYIYISSSAPHAQYRKRFRASYNTFIEKYRKKKIFTDILAGFTFNNRVLRLPAIVFWNTTFHT